MTAALELVPEVVTPETPTPPTDDDPVTADVVAESNSSDDRVASWWAPFSFGVLVGATLWALLG